MILSVLGWRCAPFTVCWGGVEGSGGGGVLALAASVFPFGALGRDDPNRLLTRVPVRWSTERAPAEPRFCALGRRRKSVR